MFSEFSSVLGSSFQIDIDRDRQLELELIEAERHGDKHAHLGGHSEPFTLLFKGPGDVMLPQRMYSLKHSLLGDLNIFLVPVAREVDGMRYEAIFN